MNRRVPGPSDEHMHLKRRPLVKKKKDPELREKLERVRDMHCKNGDSCLVSQLRARGVNLRSAEDSE